MNIKTLSIALIAILSIYTNNTFASNNQELNNKTVTISAVDTSELEKMKFGAFGEMVGVETKGEESAPDYIRKPKALPKGFTGYKIELFTVYNKAVSLNNELYTTFGGIKIERRTDNSFTYLMGDFKDKATTEKFLEQVVKSRYPEAKGVKYNNGEIVKFK